MKKILVLLLSMMYSQIGCCQDFQTEFDNYYNTNDTINQLIVLNKWKASNDNDAELYTCFFNYHFSQSRQEVLALTNDTPSGDAMVLKDSLNQTAGYLGSQIVYDQRHLKKAHIMIDEGIKRFPNRLDMRFGKVYALGQTKDWDTFTSEIIKTIQRSSENENNWTWTNNETPENGKDLLLSSIQTYQVQLYNTGNDALLVNMRKIANKILDYYPNHIESLSNLSITYLISGDYEKGLESLLRAEKINPNDFIVLSNISHAYKLIGKTKKAIEYYEKVQELGDDRAKSYAKQQLIELRQ